MAEREDATVHANHTRQMLIRTALSAAIALAWSCGGDDPVTPGTTPPPPPPGLSFTDFQPADAIIGQPDGNSGTQNGGAGSVNGAGIKGPFGNATGSLYVPDHLNRRLLGFNTIPGTDGMTADFVVGQPDCTSVDMSTVSASRFTGVDCHVSGGKLFVVSHDENRVLIWNSLPMGDVPADIVLGQANFTASTPHLTQTGFNTPLRVMTGGGRLFVLDTLNDRCLIWNTIPTTNNAPADVVVGQANFTISGASVSQTSFGTPRALWTDGTRLMIGESDGDRVLIWNSIPTSNGDPADLVVGAPDFDTPGALFDPWGIASDGRSLFVADGFNARVLIYDTIPTTNGGAPTGVLGQSNFTNIASNDDDQNGVEDATPTRRTMGGPTSVAILGTRLIVADQTNYRYMVFQSN